MAALRDELADGEPELFADTVEQLVEATGASRRPRPRRCCGAGLTRARGAGAHRPAHRARQPALAAARACAAASSSTSATEHPFALLLLDVDGLKRVNDAHGPPGR